MIMTLSMKKIVQSRSRRGGASLHRNLLVAGVLFKARDVLLAESAEKPASPTRPPVDVPPGDEGEVDGERTLVDMASSSSSTCDAAVRLHGKENVPPSSQPASDAPVHDHPVTSSMSDKSRDGKRMSRDTADDDVTPSKSVRVDDDGAPADRRLSQAPPADDDEADVASSSASDELCLETYQLSLRASVVRRSSSVSRVPCLTDASIVRPLFVVQVV